MCVYLENSFGLYCKIMIWLILQDIIDRRSYFGIPLWDQFLANDFLVRCEPVDYDPFEAAINLGHALAPIKSKKKINYWFRMELFFFLVKLKCLSLAVRISEANLTFKTWSCNRFTISVQWLLWAISLSCSLTNSPFWFLILPTSSSSCLIWSIFRFLQFLAATWKIREDILRRRKKL